MDIETRLSPDLSIDGYVMVLGEDGRLVTLPTSKFQQGYLLYHREQQVFASLHVRKEEDPVSIEDRLQIWEVIKENREGDGSAFFPLVRSIGMDDGLPYYISDFSAGTPLVPYGEGRPSWPPRLAAQVVLRFIEQVRRRVPAGRCLLAESLWIVPQAGGIPILSVDELHFHPHPEADQQNAALAERVLRMLTGTDEFPCGFGDLDDLEQHLREFLEANPAENETVSVPPLVSYLRQWFPEPEEKEMFQLETPQPQPSASSFDLKSFLELDQEEAAADEQAGLEAVQKEPIRAGNQSPNLMKKGSQVLAHLRTVPARTRCAVVFSAALVTLSILGGWLYSVSRHEPPSSRSVVRAGMAKISAPAKELSADVPVIPAPVLPQAKTLPTSGELSIALNKATQARKENRLIDAIWHEMEALQQAPDSQLIRQRIDGDLYQLQLSGEYHFSAAQMEVLYNAASLNPIANDIIVQYFRKARTDESNSREIKKLPAEKIAEMMKEAEETFARPGASPEEQKEAFLRYLAAAGQDNVEAIFRTGLCLIEGKGTGANPEKGIILLQKAVLGGYHPAMLALGKYYLEGRGIEKNEQRAAMLFAEAIERGNTGAYLELGILYAEGRGIEKNPSKAADLFEAGARKDDPACMVRFAQCLETGFGREKNSVYSLYWFRKSAIKGNAEAIAWCEKRNISVTTNTWPRATR